MARHLFGGGVADYVIQTDNARRVYIDAGVTCTFYASATGGSPLTDLLDAGSNPITSVAADSFGQLPQFYGPNDGTAKMWVSAGGTTRQLIIATDTVDRVATLEASPLSNAFYERLFGVVGTTRAAIQSALDAANTVGGGHVYVPDGTYSYDGIPLTIYSNTWLELSHAAIIARPNGGTALMLQNAAMQVTGRNVVDVTMVASSTALVINPAPQNGGGTAVNANAVFLSGDAGKQITLYDPAGVAAPFTTTVATFTDSKHVTLAAAPSFGGVGMVSFGPRDTNIKVTGGKWQAGTSTATDYRGSLIYISRCDGVEVSGLSASADTGSQYAVCLGDVTRYRVDNIVFDCANASDGVHVEGPAVSGTISRIFGSTGDDGVAILPRNGISFRTSVGAVTGLRIRDVFVSTPTAPVNFWTAGLSNAIADDIIIENVQANPHTPQATGVCVSFNTGEQQTNNVGVITLIGCRGRIGWDGLGYGGTLGVLKSISHHVEPWMVAANSSLFEFWGGATIGAVIVDGATGTMSNANNHLVGIDNAAQVGHVKVVNSKVTSTGSGSCCVNYGAAGMKLNRLQVGDTEWFSGNTGWLTQDAVGSSGGTLLELSNVITDAFGMSIFRSSATVMFTNVLGVAFGGGAGVNSNGFYVVGTPAITFRGAGLACGAHTLTANCHVLSYDMQVDVSTIAKAAGDRVYNTNASVAPGVGQVTSDGITWRAVTPDRWRVSASLLGSPYVTVAGTWVPNPDSGAYYGGWRFNSSNAQNDGATWLVDLAAGTWTLDLFFKKNPGYAIATVDFSADGGSTWTAIGTADLYAAAAIAGAQTFTGIAVSKSGPVQLRFRALTRNASASSWFLALSAAEFTRTA